LNNKQTTKVFFSPNQQKQLKQIKAQKILMRKKYIRATKRNIFIRNQLKEIKIKIKEFAHSI